MVIGGGLNGAVTCTAMKYFRAADWRVAAEASALLLPLGILICVLVVDVIDYFEKSRQMLPVTSIFFLTVLWFVMQLPASFFGSYQAWKKIEIKPPVAVSDVRRRIPEQPWYLSF